MTPATLSDICDLITEQVDPSSVDPSCAYLGLEHLAPGRLAPIGFGTASDVTSHKFLFQQDDVLYGKLRPYLDKAVLASSTGVSTTELLVLRAKPGVDPRFLACLVHAPDFIDHAMSGVTGAQHPRTSWSHIATCPIPSFDELEQKAIARVLWRVHDVIRACDAGEETAGSLKLAAMREIFSRGLRGESQQETEIGPIPSSWKLVRFKDVREWLQYGTSSRCTLDPVGSPVLRIPNIESGWVNNSQLKYCVLSEAETAKYRLESGDLIFIRTNGVLERLGCCAVYAGDPEGALFASYLIRARPRHHLVPKFAAYFFGSERGTSLVAASATPAADGKYNLNTGTIDALPLPLPPTREEQEEIVEALDILDRRIELHRRKKAILGDLFKALLHKLLTGEISVEDLDLSALPTPEEALA
jgi:type I restriction enzyme S subunit